jgi:hypothetical protein
MPRTRSRVCLQDGMRLDLNRLARKGFIKFGENIGMRGIVWKNSYWGEIVRGIISADMTDPHDSWLGIQIGESTQRITLVSRSRHFGGRQWFFVCPATDRTATVLWKPPGASRFCSRQTWGRQVAYASQFLDRDSRPTTGNPKSIRGYALWASLIPKNGICRRNQNGCAGRHTTVTRKGSTDMKHS